MKLTVPLKLKTTPLQSQALYETLVEANRVCGIISAIAWEHKAFHQVSLHKLCYHDIRSQSNLSSQIVIRCIGKVVAAYVANKKVMANFRPEGAVAFDARNLAVKTDKSYITISTLLGRLKIPFTAGARQFQQLSQSSKLGECDLILRNQKWYLYCTVDAAESPLTAATEFIGVDLGIKNLAVTSDNEVYSGAHVNSLRLRHRHLRAKLQRKGTRSAKRLLKKRSRKEHRFATNMNHIIAKSIVAKAKCTKRGIAVENLKGITSRTKVKKSQRATLHGWAFYQLKQFILYKAKLQGVEVVHVNPAHTSTTCPKCGNISRYNRKDRDHFCCSIKRKGCGYADHADYVAAINIADKATFLSAADVNQPNVSAA